MNSNFGRLSNRKVANFSELGEEASFVDFGDEVGKPGTNSLDQAE